MTDSFTKVPNALLDVLSRAPDLPRKYRILFYIVRQTYGYHRETTQKQADLVPKIVAKTGITKDHVYATMKKLIDQGVLIRDKDKRIRICDDPKKWGVTEDTKEYIDLDTGAESPEACCDTDAEDDDIFKNYRFANDLSDEEIEKEKKEIKKLYEQWEQAKKRAKEADKKRNFVDK